MARQNHLNKFELPKEEKLVPGDCANSKVYILFTFDTLADLEKTIEIFKEGFTIGLQQLADLW